MSLIQRSPKSVNSESPNCYSSAAPTHVVRLPNNRVNISESGMSSMSSQRNYSLPHNFENGEMDLNFHAQYRSPAPDCEDCEERDATVVLTDEVQDENLYEPYAETDLDNLDETTDFSQKYKERVDSYQNYNGSQIKRPDAMKNFEYPVEEASTSFSQDTVKVYCTEGTPVAISSASSLTDLRHVADVGNVPKSRRRDDRKPKEVQIEETEIETYNESKSTNKQDRSLLPAEKERHGTPPTKETKMVSFVEEINFAEETPLMFSRSSSLGSLSSFDQQGTNDDRGLTTGNCSQQTSGNISPSDLPDSPSETMPPSPRHVSRRPVFRLPPCVYPIPPPVDSVFKELPQSFAEEDTPCRISQATSLSSLTIDDVPCITEAQCISEIDIKSDGVFSDVKHKFAEEGTPFQISRAESLSPLPMDDGCDDGERNGVEIAKYSAQERNESAVVNGMLKREGNYLGSQKHGSTAIGCDVVYHGSPRMQPRHEYVYQNITRNVIADKRCERMSVPMQSHVPAAVGVTGRKIARVQIHMNSHGEDFADDDIFGDAKREFMEEGTPYQYSRRTSLSSLSFDDEPVSSAARGPVLDAVTHTTAWNSDLSNRDVDQQRGHPNRNLTFSPACAQPSVRLQSSTFADETRVYCTEDTPANISHADSYSDLTNLTVERSMHERRDWANTIDKDNIPTELDETETQICENTVENKVEKRTQISESCRQSPLEGNVSKMNAPFHSPSIGEAIHHPQNTPSSCSRKVPAKSGSNTDNALNLCGSTRRTSDFAVDAVSRKQFGSDGNIRYDDASSGRKLAGNRQSKSTVYLANVDSSRLQGMHCAYETEQSTRPCQTGIQREDVKIASRNRDDDGSAVYNSTKHPVSLPKTYPSDEDDEIDDSAIQAEVIRRGMPQSSSAPVFSAIPYVSPEQTVAGKQSSSCVESDDEANDSRILEELIRLGKQQVQVTPSVPAGDARTGHTSRPRTKERPDFLPGSQLSDHAMKPMQVSAPHTFSPPSTHDPQFQKLMECNRAGLAARRSEQAGKLQKQNLVRYEQRSCSERRRKPVNTLRSDVEYTSACDVPELYKRHEYRFKEGASANYNDFISRKPDITVMQCYASPMISRQLPSHKQVFQQFSKCNLSSSEPNKNDVPLTEPTQTSATRKTSSSPQAAQMPEHTISDSEDEEVDLKCLRELILKGSCGMSDALPKLPPAREREKLPNCPATSPMKSDPLQKKKPTASEDSALQAMARLTISSSSDVPKRESSPARVDVVAVPSCSFLDCSTQTDDLDSLPVPTAGTSSTVVERETVPKICKDSVTETDFVSHGTCARVDGLQSAVKPADNFPSASFTIHSQCNRPDASRQLNVVKPHQEKLPSCPTARNQEKSSISSNTEHCQGASEALSERIEHRTVSQGVNGQEKKKYDMPPEPPADSMERVTAIRIKLPNGRSLTRRFMASWELRVLLTFLESLGYPKDKFKILKNWRRQELSTSNPTQTLEQLKLYPKKTLTIKER
ncbi:uncharacterized protein LOC135394576 isoform X2 [Ornithodoros turicata]|uniref:uncharacterized protein LOC135394576 isoform X2 n=1 Tax=Ornithodoros turicata TaxID=34597 RepID=UPI003138DEC7